MLDKEQQTAFYEKLGDNIRDARKQCNLNQEELGERLGMSRVSIVNIETGKQRLPLHVLWDMSDVLKIKLSELVPEMTSETKLSAEQLIDPTTLSKIKKETEDNLESSSKAIDYLLKLKNK